MEEGRKDLIMREEIPASVGIQSESKLIEVVDEGTALSLMRESRGWRIVFGKFIEPRMSRDRLLGAKTKADREEVWAAVSELDALIKFIEGHIKDGRKANEKLETIRKGRI